MMLLIAFFFIAMCVKWGDWKNWRAYYPTILFIIAGDYLADFIAEAKPLFKFTTVDLTGTISHLITTLIIYPCVVLLFIPLYPKSGTVKKVLYITIWVSAFAALEYTGLIFGHYAYYNGWRFIDSVVFDSILFPVLLIHQQKPPVAWLIYFIVAVSTVIIFKIPSSH